jgi:DNA processing protein
MSADDEREARATLTRIAEPGDTALIALVAEYGAAAVVDALRVGDDLGRAEAASWRVRLEGHDPAHDLARAHRAGARLVCPHDAEWPEGLVDLVNVLSLERRRSSSGGAQQSEMRRGGPPLALWVRGPGCLRDMCERSVAIVGSRAATTYGTEVAGEIGYGVADRGVTVISGAAYGVDAAAHRGALAADAPTIAVLACGVDVSYPRGHTVLLDRIAATGLVVSEVPPGCAPSRIRFLTRNRVIAAISCGTVVVEAAIRSGALNTARWAQQLLRPVMGVPGPVTSAMSAGVHEMVRSEDALLVTDAAEVLEGISSIGDNMLPLQLGQARPRDRLDDVALRVLEAVPAVRAVGTDRIARTAGLTVQETAVKLGRLLLEDFVEQVGDRWCLSGAARADLDRVVGEREDDPP